MNYLEEITKYAPLTREEELELGRRIQQKDEEALQKLIKANLRFVVSIAKKYTGSGLTLEELINEGAIGLIEAAKKFDPDKGVKFITYAVWWIRQSILYAISTKTRVVKIPSNQIQHLNTLNKIINKKTQQLARKPTLDELAKESGLGVDVIEDLQRAARKSISIEPFPDDENPIELIDNQSMKAEEQAIEDSYANEVELLLECLDEREKEVLTLHYGLKGPQLTLQQIGNRFGLTRERIRKIEMKALSKLKRVAARRKLQDYFS